MERDQPGYAGAMVLVGDDEPTVRQVLHAQLTARGYRTYEARTGQEMLQAVQLVQPDVMLLDLGLPDMDGIEVTRQLRRRTQAPIIILSVRSSESDKIDALDAGADDYLTKPCQATDLFERIRAALRRSRNPGGQVFAAGDLKVDLSHGEVRIGVHSVQLTASEFDVLRVLALNPGRLITQSRLAREVWGEKPDGEALQLLRSTVSALRQKLETNPARPRYIATEPGVGFRLRTEA